MCSTTLLAKVKLSLGLSDDTYNTELQGFMHSAVTDLGFGNVDVVDDSDDMTATAIITFCNYQFQLIHGDMTRAEALKISYDSYKTQMGMNSKYRDWGELDG